MKLLFDTKELKRMRQAQQFETSKITIEVSKTPLQLHPQINITGSTSMNWKTFEHFMNCLKANLTDVTRKGITKLAKTA